MRSIPEQEIDISRISFIIYLQKLLYMRLETSNDPWPWGELDCGIMSKVSSVSDGSLFRVKCVISGINSCPWKWVRPNPHLYRSCKQNLAILFCLCCIPLLILRGSPGLLGWSRPAGQQRRNGQLLWSPEKHKNSQRRSTCLKTRMSWPNLA